MGSLLLHLQNNFNCGCGVCKISDKNCDTQKCNKKLGASFSFTKSFQTTTYQGPNFLKCAFTSPNGTAIFKKNETATKSSYSNIYDGTRRTLVTLPPIPAFDSRIKPTATFFEGELERKVKEGDVKDENELNYILKLLKTSLPQSGEADIFNVFLRTFNHYRGLLIQGYEPNSHMKLFIEHAEALRRQKKSDGGVFAFNLLELNILKSMNIDEPMIDAQVNSWINEIRMKTNDQLISGMIIQEALQEAIKKKNGPKTALNMAKGKFKKAQYYSLKEVKYALTKTYYDDAVRPPGEFDLMLNLRDFDMSINIEVKKQLKPEEQTTKNLNNSLNSASHQMSDHSEYYHRVMGPMLSPNHTFVKCAAILPGQLDHSKICAHCSSYLITGKTPEEIQKKVQDICFRLTKINNPFLDKKQSDQNFLNVFEAMVGFSHLSDKNNIVSNAWAQIQGKPESMFLSAGWTQPTKDLIEEELRIENVINLPHDCFKLIYFNKDQLALLYNRNQFVIFATDYGGGMYFELQNWNVFVTLLHKTLRILILERCLNSLTAS